jgi:hypothetical protein
LKPLVAANPRLFGYFFDFFFAFFFFGTGITSGCNVATASLTLPTAREFCQRGLLVRTHAQEATEYIRMKWPGSYKESAQGMSETTAGTGRKMLIGIVLILFVLVVVLAASPWRGNVLSQM